MRTLITVPHTETWERFSYVPQWGEKMQDLIVGRQDSLPCRSPDAVLCLFASYKCASASPAGQPGVQQYWPQGPAQLTAIFFCVQPYTLRHHAVSLYLLHLAVHAVQPCRTPQTCEYSKADTLRVHGVWQHASTHELQHNRFIIHDTNKSKEGH